MTEREIAAHFGKLSMARVHAALAHYYANQTQMDIDFADEKDPQEYTKQNGTAN